GMDHSDGNTAATGERPAAIAISGVAVTRNGKDLISGIDLTVPVGTHCSILGPNGAGKTTMLTLMGAQSFPTTGTVEILGGRMGRGSRTHRRRTQMSQGERAPTLSARALVTEPELLLLDEPSTGLDLRGRETLPHGVDRLREARPEVATVLITRHVEEIAAS